MPLMDKLSTADRCRIVSVLVEGNGINATARITGFNKRTVLKLLADIGTACQKFHDEKGPGAGVQKGPVR